MDNVAEPFDLITVLWRLEGFKTIEGEIGQGQSIDERGARHRYRADGSFAKATCIAPMLGGAAAATIHDHLKRTARFFPAIGAAYRNARLPHIASLLSRSLAMTALEGMSDLFHQA